MKTWEDNIFDFFVRRAQAFTNVNEWWADVLNVSRGNLKPFNDAIKGRGFKTDDINKIFKGLKGGAL